MPKPPDPEAFIVVEQGFRQFEELGMSGWLRRSDHPAADLV